MYNFTKSQKIKEFTLESLFGIYNPNNNIDSNRVASAIDALSLGKQRPITTKESSSWLFARANEFEPFSNFTLTSGHLSEELNYSKANFYKDDDTLCLETDFLGIRPLYYVNIKGDFAFCSEVEPLLKLYPNELSLDSDAISYYLSLGITPPEKTFFNEITLVPSNSLLRFKRGKTSIEKKSNPFKSLSPPTLSDIIKTLEDSTQAWIEKYSVNAANLSGGADTRLILALLTPQQRQDFRFFVDASPFLPADNDKDVIGAKQVADHFNLKLEVQSHVAVSQERNNLYDRNPPASVLKLSGNHGGEILGADVFSTLYFLLNEEALELPPQLSNYFNKPVPLLITPNQFHERYLWCVQKLFTPFYTDIYGGGSFNHWSIPHRFHLRKVAPFWSNKLIYQISLLPQEEVLNYKLYKDLYDKFFAEYAELPFFSPLASHHADIKKIEVGQNQKETLRKDKLEQNIRNIRENHSQISIFDMNSLSELAKTTPKLAKRVTNTILWLKEFYPSKL